MATPAEALKRLTDWAESQNPGVTFSGDYPIAVARGVLEAVPVGGQVTREQIRHVFLLHGFTIKYGQDDLKPCVYAAAYALLELANEKSGKRGNPYNPKDVWLARYWQAGFEGKDCPPRTGPLALAAYEEGRRASAGK